MNDRSLRLALLNPPHNPFRPAQNPPSNFSPSLHLSRPIHRSRLQFGGDQIFLGRGWIESCAEGGERGDWVGRL